MGVGEIADTVLTFAEGNCRSEYPMVSVVIPCRNEKGRIEKCLEALIQNDFPLDRLEIVVADGLSDDGTREVISRNTKIYPCIRLLDNEAKVTPAAMNKGIQAACGDVIILVNAHSIVDNRFLKNSVDTLLETGADAVGGTLKTINDGVGIVSRAIPLAADSILGAGGRRYRTRTTAGWVRDTLPYCAYRREVFERIGLIDERLIRGQDAEFNYRLIRQGGKIYYNPSIRSLLHIRPTFRKLWRQHYQYGCHRPLITQRVGIRLTWRQAIPAIFVAALAVGAMLSLLFPSFAWWPLLLLGVYLGINLAFSIRIAREEGWKYLLPVSAAFICLHFSYGFGYLVGLWEMIGRRKGGHVKCRDIPITR